MKIANGVEMLGLSAIVMGRTNIVHPVFIWDDDTTILPNRRITELADRIS